MSGRNAPRSKNGCSTCRRRKVKCGEERPVCKRCFNLRLTCEWGIPVKRGGSKTGENAPVRHLQPRWPPPTRSDPITTTTTTTTAITTATTPTTNVVAPPIPLDSPPLITTTSNSTAVTPIGASVDLLNVHFGNTLASLWPAVPGTAPDFSPASPDGFLPTSWPIYHPPPPFPQTPPLCPSLTGTDFACTNALVLSEHDRKYFQYFPSSSVVFYYMKNWQWSSFCYLYQGPARVSKVIMRMILALSASDMYRNGLVVRSPGRPTAEDHGRFHYGMAVKEFRHMLETPKAQVSRAEMEMIFATMFLMVAYEWQFGHCLRHLQLHLQGVRSLLETHPELFQPKDFDEVMLLMDQDHAAGEVASRVSFIPEQFLLWIIYIDINRRVLETTSDSLTDYVLKSDNPAIHPDQLHRSARLWSRCFWGKQYPDQEIADDMENYRALELIHDGFILWHKAWACLGEPEGTSYTPDRVYAEILSVRNRFSDLLLTAKISGAGSTRRTLNTIYLAVSNFYALILFHRRLLSPGQAPAALHRQALTGILETAHKQFTVDPRLLRRLHWPLLMALIETDDPLQRDWLRQRLIELRGFHSDTTSSSIAMSVQAAWESCSKIDTLFILVCSVFCWLIIPAVGLAYSGYSTRFNSLASFYPGLLAVAVCSIQWWMIGYSLAYSEGTSVIGDLSKAFHIGVLANPVGSIPEILFSEFQLIFCATVCAIAIGGACERGRLLPLIPFIFLWCTFIYAPLAHMVWSETGFLANLGALDFAGGTPVHICSGATATALSVYLSYPLFRSRRSSSRTPSHLTLHRPHNTLCQLLALIIIWNAWLAFDAGTTLALNFKSVMAACVTNLCAASGALTWASLTYYHTGKWSLDSTFLGAIAGLVLITPSAGFIDLPTAMGFGVLGAVCGYQALRIKFTKRAKHYRWVDNGDTFATHCLGGFLGTILTGLFAQKEVAAYDGVTDIAGGCLFDGNWGQLGVQVVEALIGFVWSFGGSYLLYALIDCVPGLEVLATDEYGLH
ncbi:Rh-like protein/ammonium transporter [Aspergillus saccharolyticus JOP 1030-1]|uniref:Rh-like protein/ammonium transporter n=1 Tax=Aspergillus saccharolyticus JOP 1030-1 TaxID=1450539 RepID=A0A318ZSR6_9EURO|nr:Rh-like protein/ammonium transporter [Aspergillus saccharolyticus JOP 1030-1]PYH49735.1 Rh-like protein/ammonium transporter [Aspergillus saccharolyticus JOP 1030-1]